MLDLINEIEQPPMIERLVRMMIQCVTYVRNTIEHEIRNGMIISNFVKLKFMIHIP